MAEQPEIETLRRDLDREVGGKRIKTRKELRGEEHEVVGLH